MGLLHKIKKANKAQIELATCNAASCKYGVYGGERYSRQVIEKCN